MWHSVLFVIQRELLSDFVQNSKMVLKVLLIALFCCGVTGKTVAKKFDPCVGLKGDNSPNGLFQFEVSAPTSDENADEFVPLNSIEKIVPSDGQDATSPPISASKDVVIELLSSAENDLVPKSARNVDYFEIHPVNFPALSDAKDVRKLQVSEKENATGSAVVLSVLTMETQAFGDIAMIKKLSHSSLRLRPVRSLEPCELPKEFEHSELHCKKYPSRIVCTHSCIYGHKFREGKQRNITCKFSENRWTPHDITEDCEPFINCKLRVLPGGRFKCTYNFLDKPPVCEISCEHYEDKAPVASQTYQCDIKSSWTPKLPFCVEPENRRSIY